MAPGPIPVESVIVPFVSVEKTLLKVEADLAEGDTAKARQRLTSLVSAFPERLDVREHLARVCRLQGDLVQAGRWSYLAVERNESEVASFEKATRNPINRMRALQWPSSPEQAETPIARERLATLLEHARAQARDGDLRYEELADRTWQPPSSMRDRASDAVAISLVVVVLLLFLIGVVNGAVTVFSWLR